MKAITRTHPILLFTLFQAPQLAFAVGPAFTELFAKADTGDNLINGRVAGKSDDHSAIAIEFTYHWQ